MPRLKSGKPVGRPSVWQNPADKQLVLTVPSLVHQAWKAKDFSDRMKIYIEKEAKRFLGHK